VDDLLNSCNCYDNEISKNASESNRRNDLIEAHREERKSLQAQIEGIRNEYKEVVKEQNSLIEIEKKENALVKKENSDLQRLLGLSESQAKQLEIRLTEKTNKLEMSEEALNKLRQAFLELSISNEKNAVRAEVISEQLDWTRGRLEKNDGQIAVFENKLDQKQQEAEELRQSLATLRITYQTEVQSKDIEIKKHKDEIKSLKEKTGQAQEKFSNEREHLKEGKLAEFALQFGVNLQQLDTLRKYYERLIVSRKNYNQTNIATHEGNIMTIKQEMLNAGVNITNIQKICRKCEKLAEVRFELEGIRQQQYQAHQEQPINN
jgi:chromosome segregation ATPase